jgi:hypothetical protein
MKHLLVTNDFPPKIGGIQSLLWSGGGVPADRFAVLPVLRRRRRAGRAAAVPGRARP